MKKEYQFCIAIVLITAILASVSAVFLPDMVRVQHSMLNGSALDLPKIWGILLATVLSISGAVGLLISKQPESKKYGILVITVLGYFLFVYMFLASWSI